MRGAWRGVNPSMGNPLQSLLPAMPRSVSLCLRFPSSPARWSEVLCGPLTPLALPLWASDSTSLAIIHPALMGPNHTLGSLRCHVEGVGLRASGGPGEFWKISEVRLGKFGHYRGDRHIIEESPWYMLDCLRPKLLQLEEVQRAQFSLCRQKAHFCSLSTAGKDPKIPQVWNENK